MRTDISVDRRSWLYRLDYKKLIIIAFLLRFILASAYDIFVTVTAKELLVPDSKFYSVRGRYIDLLLQGYDMASFTWDLVPSDKESRAIFFSILQLERGRMLPVDGTSVIYMYIIGVIYHVLGYFTIWIRLLNISLSILSAYLLFEVAKRHFGGLAANLFLLIALFLPTQFGYSITLSRDFLRVFVISLTIWVVYNMGDICLKRLKLRLFC